MLSQDSHTDLPEQVAKLYRDLSAEYRFIATCYRQIARRGDEQQSDKYGQELTEALQRAKKLRTEADALRQRLETGEGA